MKFLPYCFVVCMLALAPLRAATYYMPFDYSPDSDLRDAAGTAGIPWNAESSVASGFAGNWGNSISGGVVSGAPASQHTLSSSSTGLGTLPTAWNSTGFTFPSNDLGLFPANGGGSSKLALDANIATNIDQTLYFSALLRSGNTTDFIRFRLETGSGGSTGLEFGLGGGNWLGSSSVAALADTTYFLVGQIDTFASGADTLRYNVYSGSDALPTSAPTTFSFSTSGSNSGAIEGFSLFTRTVNGGGLDEIRIGDTYAAVAGVPEPSSAMLAILAAGCLAFCRRRRS